MSRNVLDNVRMISPSAIGVLDDQVHHITYRTRIDTPLVHSEPVPVEAINVENVRALLGLTDWRGADVETSTAGPLVDRPVLLDDSYFDRVTDSMKQAASDAIGARVIGRLIGDMDSMTSFGRARTTGRLLFGAELLALPAAGQEVG